MIAPGYLYLQIAQWTATLDTGKVETIKFVTVRFGEKIFLINMVCCPRLLKVHIYVINNRWYRWSPSPSPPGALSSGPGSSSRRQSGLENLHEKIINDQKKVCERGTFIILDVKLEHSIP